MTDAATSNVSAPSPWSASVLATAVAIGIGLLAMFGPTYYNLATGLWQTDDQAHGMIIFAIVLWLFWQVREPLLNLEPAPAPVTGSLLLLAGLLFYVLGRSQDIVQFDIGSQVLVLPGLFLLLGGWRAVRIAWFPLLYLIFLVPLPGIFIDTVTAPLKHYISIIAEWTLYHAGLPIARSGNIITVGPYQLLVADACSGLHSMFSLSALGVLFMYLMQRTSRAHNAFMLLSILPVAFVANLVRVMVLILVTYYMGDEAGQGFLHGAAGMVLLVAALIFLFMLDGILTLIFRPKKKPEAN